MLFESLSLQQYLDSFMVLLVIFSKSSEGKENSAIRKHKAICKIIKRSPSPPHPSPHIKCRPYAEATPSLQLTVVTVVISLCQSNYVKSSILVVFHNPQHTEQNNAADSCKGTDGIIIAHTPPPRLTVTCRKGTDPIISRTGFLVTREGEGGPWLHLCHLGTQPTFPLGKCKTNNVITLRRRWWGGCYPRGGTALRY